MKLPKAFGTILKEVRESKKVSQENLALEADLDRTYISLLERGLRQPSLGTLFDIAKVLGCRASDLVRKTEDFLSRKG